MAVTIPAEFTKKTGVKVGDDVKVETQPLQGKMIITFPNIRQLSLIK